MYHMRRDSCFNHRSAFGILRQRSSASSSEGWPVRHRIHLHAPQTLLRQCLLVLHMPPFYWGRGGRIIITTTTTTPLQLHAINRPEERHQHLLCIKKHRQLLYHLRLASPPDPTRPLTTPFTIPFTIPFTSYIFACANQPRIRVYIAPYKSYIAHTVDTTLANRSTSHRYHLTKRIGIVEYMT